MKDQGKLDEAIKEYREAIRLNPDDPYVHGNLGIVLSEQGKLDEAIKEYREAIRLNPDDPIDHNNLGEVLLNKGQLDEAIKEYREAIRLKPDQAEFHSNLGELLARQGKLAEAIANVREAIRLKPDFPEAHANLGIYLRDQGDYTEAIIVLRKARELAKANSKYAQKIERDLTETEQQASLETRLPTVLAGKLKPIDVTEMLGFARLCHKKGLFVASAQLWAEAFRSRPKLADDMDAKHRYNAACSAALAGCGQGQDNPLLDDTVKVRWCKQAIDWLKADLAAWSEILQSGPPQARQAVAVTLHRWKADPDLSGMRDQTALAKLPDGVQKTCRALWAEVDVMLAKAHAGTKP